MTGSPTGPSLAQIVAALSVSYSDAGVLRWLDHHRGVRVAYDDGVVLHLSLGECITRGRRDAIADAVRCIGDADPDDFTITRNEGETR